MITNLLAQDGARTIISTIVGLFTPLGSVLLSYGVRGRARRRRGEASGRSTSWLIGIGSVLLVAGVAGAVSIIATA